jgi:hypothetical protein
MANECTFMPCNKLHKYHVRIDEVVCNCLTLCDTSINNSVIFGHDVDFGPVGEFFPLSDTEENELLLSQRIDPSKLAHMLESQRSRLLVILDRYQTWVNYV